MERKPIVNPKARGAHSSGSALGRVPVEKKALRIQELSDKIGFAIKQYEAAQRKFEKGEDSYKEWENIIKLLNAQIKDVESFVAVATHNLGIIHAGRHEFDKAEKLLLKAIALNPDYAMAYYNLAVVYKNLGDIPQAKEFLAKAKSLGYPPKESSP
jgi:tetratricopeptide (TPR) repeat protein